MMTPLASRPRQLLPALQCTDFSFLLVLCREPTACSHAPSPKSLRQRTTPSRSQPTDSSIPGTPIVHDTPVVHGTRFLHGPCLGPSLRVPCARSLIRCP